MTSILVLVKDFNNSKIFLPININLTFKTQNTKNIDLKEMHKLLKQTLIKKTPKSYSTDNKIYSVSIKTQGIYNNTTYIKTQDLSVIIDKIKLSLQISEPA